MRTILICALCLINYSIWLQNRKIEPSKSFFLTERSSSTSRTNYDPISNTLNLDNSNQSHSSTVNPYLIPDIPHLGCHKRVRPVTNDFGLDSLLLDDPYLAYLSTEPSKADRTFLDHPHYLDPFDGAHSSTLHTHK